MDVEWARRKLWEGYELGRSMPTQLMGLMKQEQVSPQLLLPRLGSLSRDRINWLLEAPSGSVRYGLRAWLSGRRQSSCPTLHHSQHHHCDSVRCLRIPATYIAVRLPATVSSEAFVHNPVD